MPQVTVYTTHTCPYCDRARRLLKRKGVAFAEIPVDHDRARMAEMVERSGRHTVPQIFIDDFHVGGYDDMALLDMDGELDERLGLDSDD
ncbi:glutaredoxin 3 [Allochromatium palmeri]|uniref:Glutaredoxin n=1 Tax=Allochromatium palmeri TaxID=231048 RepID=A0A6N8ECP3_9GAMM|nr:glutaredoxin 3 [Allochromatium palmeri]MTW20124.1 glutaredoxin 3 [Allochromatium palmeri]